MYKHVLYLIDAILFKKQHLNKKKQYESTLWEKRKPEIPRFCRESNAYDITLPSSEGM